MAALVRNFHLKKIFSLGIKAPAVNCLLSRNHWTADWKAGPYPRTPEEREAAAKKYGLLPQDYEPYPDDGLGFGDYPKLKDIGDDDMDPHYPWDYPAYRKNFGEVIHIDADIFGQDRHNPSAKTPMSYNMMALTFLGIVAGYIILLAIGDLFTKPRPLLPKQYPTPGVVHYTFEPADPK